MALAIPHAPRCIVIAGPNGAGKTTFAREFLPRGAGVTHFVSADLIAAGVSPFRPALVALSAGRLVLRELDRLAASRVDFAFESTPSGRSCVGRLRRWKKRGYRIEIVFLRLTSPELALRRIAARVKQGGHDEPKADVIGRFGRGWTNFGRVYRPLADAWAVYDNSGESPALLEKEPSRLGRNRALSRLQLPLAVHCAGPASRPGEPHVCTGRQCTCGKTARSSPRNPEQPVTRHRLDDGARVGAKRIRLVNLTILVAAGGKSLRE